MESLSDTKWDVVISGTGLQQSILALALSRSDKNILHVDPNDYYGGAEAALTLADAEDWAKKHAGSDGSVFAEAAVSRDDDALASARSYSLALAPQVVHARSDLLKQLVSSKAFRQIEFLAVGSFFIHKPAAPDTATALHRIPSTREDVFSNRVISNRAKRLLMKFLKFVLDLESEQNESLWKENEHRPLVEFLESKFSLDSDLRSYVVTLTLSLDGKISVGAGLKAINRHLKSMGVFGAGFAAVYPKWGGLSEVAQVGCRACAVGGSVYMLGVGISGVQQSPKSGKLEVSLTNDLTVSTAKLVRAGPASGTGLRVGRLVAIVDSPLPSMFQVVVEDAPTPCAAVVAFPAGTVIGEDGSPSEFPIYALVHSSDTGECPVGQCTVYLSSPKTSQSKSLLDTALSSFLSTFADGADAPKCIWKMHYTQAAGNGAFGIEGNIGTFDLISPEMAFNDDVLPPVQQAWEMVTGADNGEGYMKFEDREGANDEDDVFNT